MSDLAAAARSIAGHPTASTGLFSALTAADLGNVRASALDAGTKSIVGLGALGALALAREKVRGRDEARHVGEMEGAYQKMMEKNPELAKHPEDKVKDFFSQLSEFSPAMAKHPHVSGSWVKSHIRYSDEGVPFSSTQDLISAQKAYEDTARGQAGIGSIQALIGGNTPLGMKVR